MWNYSKLCFNTKYPWESAVAPDIEAQQYVLYDGVSDEIKKGNVTYWHGLKNDVLYRRQFFNYDLENECHWIQAINLADFTVPYGVTLVPLLPSVSQVPLFSVAVQNG